MQIPERVDARWIETLADSQLLTAEEKLRAEFAKREQAEKKIRGSRYEMMRGPSALVNAWLRWLLVSNAARTRGLAKRAR